MHVEERLHSGQSSLLQRAHGAPSLWEMLSAFPCLLPARRMMDMSNVDSVESQHSFVFLQGGVHSDVPSNWPYLCISRVNGEATIANERIKHSPTRPTSSERTKPLRFFPFPRETFCQLPEKNLLFYSSSWTISRRNRFCQPDPNSNFFIKVTNLCFQKNFLTIFPHSKSYFRKFVSLPRDFSHSLSKTCSMLGARYL